MSTNQCRVRDCNHTANFGPIFRHRVTFAGGIRYVPRNDGPRVRRQPSGGTRLMVNPNFVKGSRDLRASGDATEKVMIAV